MWRDQKRENFHDVDHYRLCVEEVLVVKVDILGKEM